jgi:hypothetical protein
MYQKERKEEFIRDIMRSRVIQKTTLFAIFKKTEPFEEKFDKDCCQFNKDEAMEMFNGFKCKSIYTLLNNNTIMKAYSAFAEYYHGIKSEKVYESFTINDLKPCVAESKNKLITREGLNDIKSQLLNAVDRCIVEALWEGISGTSMSDITGLQEEQLDKTLKQLHFEDGRVLNLTDELYEDLVSAFKQTKYICYGETLREKTLLGYGRLYKERDNALGALDSEDRRFRWIYRKVQIFRDHVGMPWLTMKIIQNSGFTHYLKIGMDKCGLEIKDFLKTEEGKELMIRYGYNSQFAVDNVVHKYKDYV